MLIDSHAHIYDETFAPFGGAQPIIESMATDGLEYIICVGCDVPTSRECVRLARENERIYATVGIHPYDAATATPENLDILRELSREDKVVAIGEFGLDFHREGSDRVGQAAAMAAQYELARELHLPIILHLRDGYGEFCDFIRNKDLPDGGIIHCFSSSAEVAEILVKKGFHISFSGTVTYRNAVNLVRAASAVPMERLLIETDSPYLTPSRKNGEINFPRNVAFVRDKLAEIKGVSPDEIERVTNENVKRVLRLK